MPATKDRRLEDPLVDKDPKPSADGGGGGGGGHEFLYDQNMLGVNSVDVYTRGQGLTQSYHGKQADEAWANRDGSGMPRLKGR